MAPLRSSVAHNYAIRHLQALSLKRTLALTLALFLHVTLAMCLVTSCLLLFQCHCHGSCTHTPIHVRALTHTFTQKQWDKRHMQAIQLDAVCCCWCMLPTPLPQTTTWCATESRTLAVGCWLWRWRRRLFCPFEKSQCRVGKLLAKPNAELINLCAFCFATSFVEQQKLQSCCFCWCCCCCHCSDLNAACCWSCMCFVSVCCAACHVRSHVSSHF